MVLVFHEKKKKIEFSDSGFPSKNKRKKKFLRKKKKTWKTWIRESGSGFPQKKKKKKKIEFSNSGFPHKKKKKLKKKKI